MKPLTDAEIAAMDTRATAATPGPLRAHAPHPGSIYTPQILMETGGILAEMTSYGNMRADAEFFAHARTDQPRLSDDLKRLRARLKWMRTASDYDLRPHEIRRMAAELLEGT